jgi:hypothetical protein
MATIEVEERPILRMQVWAKGLGEAAMELLSGMTSLDPKARLVFNQVLDRPYWTEDT